MPRVEYIDYEVLEENGWSVDDDNLFEKARNANLAPEEYGVLDVEEDESILLAAEDNGFDWPYGCRQGMCASCTCLIRDGEIDMEGQQILDDDQIDAGARVTCIGTPDTDELQIVFNAKQHL